MKVAAGLLLYDLTPQGARVLLVHPSGTYNKNAPWGLPKGEPDDDEELERTARRETAEETGVVVDGPLVSLGFVDYTKSKKRVHAWAAPLPPGQEPRVAQWEVDRAEMLLVPMALAVIHADQRAFVERLAAMLERSMAALAAQQQRR